MSGNKYSLRADDAVVVTATGEVVGQAPWMDTSTGEEGGADWSGVVDRLNAEAARADGGERAAEEAEGRAEAMSRDKPIGEHADGSCPTYNDGCHCTVETLRFNIERAQAVESALALSRSNTEDQRAWRAKAERERDEARAHLAEEKRQHAFLMDRFAELSAAREASIAQAEAIIREREEALEVLAEVEAIEKVSMEEVDAVSQPDVVRWGQRMIAVARRRIADRKAGEG